MSDGKSAEITNRTILPASPLAGYLAHKSEIDFAIQSVLNGGWYILGPEVSAFEAEFSQYIGVEFGIGVSTGTDAIELGLRALGIGAGSSVLTVSHTAVATAFGIAATGAKPIFIDIDESTFTIDLNQVEHLLQRDRGRHIKAVVPVHLYGHPVDMTALMQLAERYGVFVLEDCAQAHGALWEAKRVGSFGHCAAFSFYPTKNLGALGDGGALVTSNARLADKARLLRQYGWKRRYVSEVSEATNSRLDELQAAILRVKLRFLDEENARRRSIAKAFGAALSRTNIKSPLTNAGGTHVYHQYVIRAHGRQDLQARLKAAAIETAILYPIPLHLQPAYLNAVEIAPGGLPITEKICPEILSLPIYPELDDTDIARVTQVLSQYSN